MNAATKHRANEVIQLSEIAHVKLRKGMYVGDTSRSYHKKWVIDKKQIKNEHISISLGLLKLFDEIISNSVDEALRTNFEFANKIEISITGNSITCTDNGRGVPVVLAKGSKITQAEMAFTSLRAGSNFGDEKFVSIGTNGLGSTLVNIFSTFFRAETCDGTNKLILTCSNNLSSSVARVVKAKTRGTTVQFTPDFSLFEDAEGLNKDDMRMIEKRLLDLSVSFPEITFTYQGKTVNPCASKLKFKKYAALYSDEMLISSPHKDYQVAVFPTGEPTTISFVNGIDTYDGGTHVTVVSQTIINMILEAIKKKHKKLDIKPQDIRNHLGIIIFTNSIKGAKFRSQTKEYITNSASEISPIFADLKDDSKFFKQIINNDNFIDPIVESKLLKLEAAERLAMKKAKGSAKKIRVAKHVAANSKDPRKKILFLSEGSSASGQLLSVRDPAIHGSYPLRGKVMNISGKKPSEILANEELKNLLAIIGLHIGSPAVDLNYGKIVLMVDADVDGTSIAALLINVFARWPELFNEKKIVLLATPIVTATKGKDIKRFYNLTEYNDAKDKLKGYEITYLKGLGSLPIEEYKKIIQDPIYVPIVLSKDYKAKLEMAFGNDSGKRKEWLES